MTLMLHIKPAAPMLACAILLAACATPYLPPLDPPPPAWDGAFGYTPIEEPVLREGVLHAGDAIISQGVAYLRTGVIAQTVETKGAFGGPLILPKGARAYATNYGLIEYGVVRQGWTDPVDWCVILDAGKDGLQTEPETVCLLYESPLQARYIETFDKGGFPFDPYLGEATGMAGPLPVIDEQPVDFGPLRTELQVLEIKDGQLVLADVLTDGQGKRILERRRHRLGKSGALSLELAGRRVLITSAGSDAVEVRTAPLAER